MDARIRVTFLPEGLDVLVAPGTTVLRAAQQHRIMIRTRCEGKLGCLLCKVRIDEADAIAPTAVTPPAAAERLKLGEHALMAGYRYACQTVIRGDVTVHVPEDPLKAAIRRQLAASSEDDDMFGSGGGTWNV